MKWEDRISRRREIGLGNATQIDEIEIRWHGSGEIHVFRKLTGSAQPLP